MAHIIYRRADEPSVKKNWVVPNRTKYKKLFWGHIALDLILALLLLTLRR